MTALVKPSPRNPKIDLLRGWLMLLVIIGHIVLGSVHENFVRYTIYAFHMPLFIGLSGFLINAETLATSNFIAVLRRYWWRVLLPFVFAFLFYTGILAFHAHQEARLSQDLLVSYATSPYYHLWFIPTLVIWVIVLWAALKIAIPPKVLLVVFLVLSAAWASLNRAEMWPLLAMLLSKKVVYFFSFFLFGAWLKTTSSHKLMRIVSAFKVLPAALVMLCAVIYWMNIGPDHTAVRGFAWLLMNLALIAIAVAWMTSKKPTKTNIDKPIFRTLIAMGRVSLPIYLWHAVPMFLLKGWDIHQTHPWVYYGASIVGVAVILTILIKLEGKSKVLDKMLYGV